MADQAGRRCCDCSHWREGVVSKYGGYCRSPKFMEFVRQNEDPEFAPGELRACEVEAWQMRSIASLCGQFGKWFDPKPAP